MAYNLKRMTRLAGLRRRVIKIPAQHVFLYQEAALARATLAPVKVWEAQASSIIAAYTSALSQMTRDSAESDMSAAILYVSELADRVGVNAAPYIEEWLESFSSGHARRFARNIKAKTTIDPWPYIDVAANADDIAAFQARISSLIKDISEQARKDVSEVVWRSVINRTPPRIVGKEIAERLQIARNRANFIASDQANKVNAFLTEIRQEEAGLDEFMWETAKDTRVRPEHRVLQGRVFKWKKPPAVGLPGTPPRCRCTGAAYIDMSEYD